MLHFLQRLVAGRDETGASAVEYGLLLAAIAAIVAAILLLLGPQVKASFQSSCDAIKTGNNGGTAATCT
ncbi:MAG: hypothetical protein AVDCRST_MAG36-2811 [uncultured Nocardioidaceae bacterium]|uniref:Flp pilus assembly protein, pilin Flp n=1 Tax=uncultured Nocardioidaceae bacterium TaxID=253824 RepID=A0A6J4MPT9_9ACTN|nr:MAG: hypothetical protein AVDCRST_MAG36-2811 [uncultured Nocardioidaceae bacterium]